MTSRRAQRRRVPATIPLRLQARHGRVTFVYSFSARGAVRVIGEHETHRVLKIAFPHLAEDSVISLVPGVSAPEDVLGWASEIREQIPAALGDRVLITAVCEHIRTEEAKRFGWDTTPDLVSVFEQYPEHWLVYAAMPTSRPVTHTLDDFPSEVAGR